MNSPTTHQTVLADKINKISDSSTKRTAEDAKDLLSKCDINQDDLKQLTQSVFIDNSILTDDWKLLELTSAQLRCLTEGDSLTIRGNETENAICCTKSETFTFKVAEISNMILVTPDLVFPGSSNDNSAENDSESSSEQKLKEVRVVTIADKYFAMEKFKPKLQKLRSLLEMNFYCGQSLDEQSDAVKYTIHDLLDIIQSSEEEIYNYLNFIEAYKVEGYWRLLDYKYHSELMDNILKLVDERSWRCDTIPVSEIFDELKPIYSLSILHQIVNYYFVRQEGSGFNTEEDFHKIRKDKLCRFYAETLLRTTMKMRLVEFVSILKRTLPSSLEFEFSMDQIQDVCYVEENYVYYFNVLDLPDEIEKRFKCLFEKRKRWNFDELSAFMRDLCSSSDPKSELNSLLTKYCRSFTQNNVRYYTSRIS
jgi:sister chromatid cohesion protein DCC1